MRNATATLLITTSILILAAIACSSRATDEQQISADSLIADRYNAIASTLDQVPLADCELLVGGTQPLESWAKTPEQEQSLYEYTLGQTNTGSPPLNPETATLEQILERSRLAMGDIVTYKTCGMLVERDSFQQEFGTPDRSFGVFHSYDNYRTMDKRQGIMSDFFTEILAVGSQHFIRTHNHGWEESSEPPAGGMQPSPPSTGFARDLYRDDIKLVSTSELADNGEKVFRLAFPEKFENSANGEIVYNTATNTVLISQKTFRIVTKIRDKHADYPATANSNGKTAREAWWWHVVATTHYYDFNLPVVITVPENYIPWQETVMAR